MTINKDTKSPGGTTGFSLEADAIMRWTLNASYRAELRKYLYSHLNYSPEHYPHKDLSPSCILQDEQDIQAITDVAQTFFVSPFSKSELVCISNGMIATKEIKDDLLSAEEKGRAAMKEFIESRLAENAEVEFFSPIKKMKLRTFATMKKTAKNKVKNKIIPIESHSNMFGQLALLMQHHEINLKEVFEYPIGPYPWSLCGRMGELRKTCKSTLLRSLEKGVDPEKQNDDETTTVLDGIALVQTIKT